jgi:GT2 family glycosyltransferase
MNIPNPPNHGTTVPVATEHAGKSNLVSHKIEPSSGNGANGKIQAFSAAGISGWVMNFSESTLPVLVQAKLDGIVVAQGKTFNEGPDRASLGNIERKFSFLATWRWENLAIALRAYQNHECPPVEIFTPMDSRPIVSQKRPTAGEFRKWLKEVGFFPISHEPFSIPWLSAISGLKKADSTAGSSFVEGCLDAAIFSKKLGKTIFFGWTAGETYTTFWLEDGQKNRYPLDCKHEFFRKDVYESIKSRALSSVRAAGMICIIEIADNVGPLKLRALTEVGIHTLHEIVPVNLPASPIEAAKFLFGGNSPLGDFSERVRRIDRLILDPLIKSNTDRFDDLPVEVLKYGRSPENPLVSIIIPLFGRADFVEHQLLEFDRDPWLKQHAEILYVLDDPAITEDFQNSARTLYRLYQVPFQVIWGSANRGFSGANNLGAKHARGQYLLFMNSDVFPQAPGWLNPLVETLVNDDQTGAVAPRLVFLDGSIQHAGMVFKHREDLNIWINHHPNMGLDPKLDPQKETSKVPAVTGACLLLRRRDFDRVGGWDTGYLVGDFEDSDLCLKLRTMGLEIAYNPNVQLTHLERQSFKLLGEGEFRTRVTIYNAARHQSRWESMIASNPESISS